MFTHRKVVLVAPSTSENKVRFDRIDSRNLLSHLDRLATFENRIAGTDQIREASLYINEKLSEIQGIVAYIDNFPIFTSFPLNSEIIDALIESISIGRLRLLKI